MAATLFPVTKLDHEQVLTHAYDEGTQSLRTKATIDTSGGDVEVAISHLEDSIRLGDGTDFFTSTVDSGKRALDVFLIGGEIELSGLSGGITTAAITITDVATKIPASAFAGRDTMAVRIIGAETVYIGGSTVTVANGFPKFQNETIELDITDSVSVELHGICESGKSSEVRAIEIAG